MKTITQEQFNKSQWTDVWDTDNVNMTNFNGRKTILINVNGGCRLLIEGESFIIVETQKENINPIILS